MSYDDDVTDPGYAPMSLDLAKWVPRVVIAALVFEVFLIGADVVFNMLDPVDDRSIRRIFNVAREESFPTWFASGQAMAVGVTAYVLALLDRARGHRVIGWFLVGLFFTYVSADDASEIHERVGSTLGRKFEADSLPTYSWQVFVAPVLAVCLLSSSVYAFFRIKTRVRWLLIVALGCFGLSQGLDFVEGFDDYDEWLEDRADEMGIDDYWFTHTPRMFEEWLEMLGTTTFLGVFLSHLATSIDGGILRLGRPTSRTEPTKKEE